MSIKELDDFFEKNRDAIVKGRQGKFAVIYENDVKGYFASFDKALAFAVKKKYELGNFLVKECFTKENEPKIYLSRASFG